MSCLAILDPVADTARWDSLVERMPAQLQDIHFTSAYARVQKHSGERPLLAAYESEWMLMLQPFVLRATTVDGQPVNDIVSPCGFGGPVCDKSWRTSKTIYLWLMHDWSAWLRDNGIVCEYCVLHPLLDEHQRYLLAHEVTLVDRKQTICLDLDSDEKMLAAMERNRLRGVNKAQVLGVTVEICEPTKENIFLFGNLYGKSMARLKAKDVWRFSAAHIASYFQQLGQYATLLFARDGTGAVETALLMLHYGRTAYAHLLGSRRIITNCGIDDLLYYRAAQIARGFGCIRFHLGGGRTTASTDGLLAYKRAFGGHVLPVRSYFRIFDQLRYDQLCSRVAPSDYLPAYRSASA